MKNRLLNYVIIAACGAVGLLAGGCDKWTVRETVVQPAAVLEETKFLNAGCQQTGAKEIEIIDRLLVTYNHKPHFYWVVKHSEGLSKPAVNSALFYGSRKKQKYLIEARVCRNPDKFPAKVWFMTAKLIEDAPPLPENEEMHKSNETHEIEFYPLLLPPTR
jgi:hypothetical protein